MRPIWMRIFEKLLSGRYIITITITITLCFLTMKSFALITNCLGNVEIFAQAKEVAMFVLGAFIAIAQNIATSYFQRTDRKTTQNEDQTGEGK